MKTIPLGCSEAVALVDDEDYALLSRFCWSLVWTKNKRQRYASCTLGHEAKRIQVRMHHLILGGVQRRIDHIDGDGLNNQKLNLRPATQTENMWNRKVQKHSSRYKGVTFLKRTGKWIASIRLQKVKKHLGTFTSEIDAARAYDAAAAANFGNFARTNQMEGLLN